MYVVPTLNEEASKCTYVYACIVLKHYVQDTSMALVLQGAISILKQDYKDTPSLKDSLDLAIKVLSKTIDSSKLTTDKGNVTRILKISLKSHPITFL